MSETYTCWKCGGTLLDLLLPLARHEECPHCRVQLHVCRSTVEDELREQVEQMFKK